MTDFLRRVFAEHAMDDAIVWRGETHDYGSLLERWQRMEATLREAGVGAGSVVALEADFSPDGVAAWLALASSGCVVVPLTAAVETRKEEFRGIAEAETRMVVEDAGAATLIATGTRASHPLYETLRRRRSPGLVLFSSGSSGKVKAAVHDLTALLEKYTARRHRFRTLTFMLYDHIGGVDTLLYTLSNGACLVTVGSRQPDDVLAAVERHRVEVLPTTPTFLNLMLLSESHRRFDLSSLRIISYGTEPMAQATLRRLHALFPRVKLLQKYGLTEVGTLRSQSRAPDSLWVRVGGEGFETRVVNGVLQVRARSAMLGYLNHPSPFTPDGWFDTGDAVEVDGEYLRILGRVSDIINVGGEKVYPAEVESVLESLENVAEAQVFGERHAFTGNIVCARVRLASPEPVNDAVARIRAACHARLERYKVPVKIVIDDAPQHTPRFKKSKRAAADRDQP